MSGAFHGGQFWQNHRESLRTGLPNPDVINADVLDAWFPPPPEIISALNVCSEWQSRTSPPTNATEVTEVIARARRLDPSSVLLGPGSSALMFLAWRQLLDASSKVMLVEPTYGEYRHLSTNVVGAEVVTFSTSVNDQFRIHLDFWLDSVLREQPDIAVLVNPNNPTGAGVDVGLLADRIPSNTLLWVDEAYIDYTQLESAEHLAATRPNVIVVKSLSKAYALSGLRAAYLVACPATIEKLAKWSPPWSVSLPAQIASTLVWEHLAYYAVRHQETVVLRGALVEKLAKLALNVVAAEGNWVLVQLSEGLSAEKVVQFCMQHGVFLRNAGSSAVSLGDSFVRIAVKPESEQERILQVIEMALKSF
ncbi:MAG TPA: histidinol-phosphate transaminase [Fimbriimonas sp.]|nr:histidinol-phosphate transaminase [Fimbriimonas sp.]